MSNSKSNAGVVYGKNGHNGDGESSHPSSASTPVLESGICDPVTPLSLGGSHTVVEGIVEAFQAGGISAAHKVFDAMQRAAPELASLAPHTKTRLPDEWQLYTLETALQPRPPLNYLVDKLLAYPSLFMFFAPPDSFKSMVLMDLVISVVTGTPFLSNQSGEGGFHTEQAPVLWYDYDNGTRRCAERFGAMAKARGLSLDSPLSEVPFYYVSVPTSPLNLNNDESVAYLSQVVKRKGIRLLVIDNLATVSGGVDENSTQMARVLGNLRILVEEHELACGIIHHARKDNKSGNRPGSNMRGSTSIEASLDYGFRVDTRGEKEIMITVAKARGQQIAPLGAVFTNTNRPDEELEVARFYGTTVVNKRSTLTIEQTILAAVKTQPSINQRDLSKKVKEQLGTGENRVKEVAQQMAEKKLLAVAKGPRNATLYSLPGSNSVSQELKKVAQN
jgi:hypothetical protein